MGRVMAPRIALLALDGSGDASFAEVVGGTRWWSRREPCSVGGYPAFEFRHPASDVIVVIVRIAARQLPDGRQGALVVVWVVAETRTGVPTWLAQFAQDLRDANILIKSWACELTGDALTCSALDADNTQVGVGVKNAWPATWRVYMPGDADGAPSGARCIGAEIAG